MIYLDDTQKEHELLIKAIENSFMPPWIKKSLIGRIQSDIDEKMARAACEHIFGEYKGHKECCTRCGGYDINQGESWMLTNKEKGEQTTHQEKSIGNTALDSN